MSELITPKKVAISLIKSVPSAFGTGTATWFSYSEAKDIDICVAYPFLEDNELFKSEGVVGMRYQLWLDTLKKDHTQCEMAIGTYYKSHIIAPEAPEEGDKTIKNINVIFLSNDDWYCWHRATVMMRCLEVPKNRRQRHSLFEALCAVTKMSIQEDVSSLQIYNMWKK